MNRCQGFTKERQQCKNAAKYGSYCHTHKNNLKQKGGLGDSSSGFEVLPLELKRKIALGLQKQEASKLFQTSKSMEKTTNENYWYLRTLKDFEHSTSKGNYQTWKAYYCH